MTSNVISIESDTLLDDIEHCFRVIAGPGAGKTHWLANHIRHVARKSVRLNPCARVGVISYTNVAVREIVRRLDGAANATDASTIHSFLFRNIVRPYLHFLKASDGADLASHSLVDTHSEHFVAHNHLDDWLTANKKRQLLTAARKHSLDLLKSRLRMLTVRIDDTGSAYFVPCKSDGRDSAIKDLLQPEQLLAYKRSYWLRGVVDHEDVLYFAHQLLHKFPLLRQFFSARFPYLFIDEFQDTLPVQAAIVAWLAEHGTVIGVIGDPEQAIYGFLDASPTHFHEFCLAGHRTYRIDGNRRSTQAILSLLNHVRCDGVQQIAIRKQQGNIPTVYGGDLGKALEQAKSDSSAPLNMLVLARNHHGVLRARLIDTSASNDAWELIDSADSERCRFLQQLLSAVDLAQRHFYDIAVQRLVQGISSRSRFRDPLQFGGEVQVSCRRSLALMLIECLLSRHAELQTSSVLELYKTLEALVPTFLPGMKLKAATRGKFCDTAAQVTYADLIGGLKTAEETRLVRTIHQAKGGEASSVFVVLEADAVDHVLKPRSGDEEHRITYVALSRAMDELHIFCSDAERLPEFEALGLSTFMAGAAHAS